MEEGHLNGAKVGQNHIKTSFISPNVDPSIREGGMEMGMGQNAL
jgi:hypothetical protein